MKKQVDSIARRRRAVAIIVKDNSKISMNAIVKKLKSDYQIFAVRQTVARDLEFLKKNENYLTKQSETIDGLDAQEGELARMLEDAKAIQDSATSQQVMLKAISEQKRIVKLQSELSEKRALLDIKQAEVTRPIHPIIFGQLECSSKVCPNCRWLFVDKPKEQHKFIKEYCLDDAERKEKERCVTAEHKKELDKEVKKRVKDDEKESVPFGGTN